MQKHWCNEETFPTSKTGHDPLIGQAKGDGLLHTMLHDGDDKGIEPGLGEFQRMVTMKGGGDYFFVPSIAALGEMLGV